MGDSKRLINELLHGLELVRQLQIYVHAPSSSNETRDLLIQRIISTFEKALEMVNWKGPVGESSRQQQYTSGVGVGVAIRMSESPPLSGSPCSEDSDRDFKDQDHNPSRKRNTLPRWTKQIRVTPGLGVEGPLDDGYSWRKYGQKDILGATYPRGYYRCTHRNVQGCLATKQVQRSDEDPTVFEITYRGKHTCTMASSSSSSNVVAPNNQESNIVNTNPQQQQQQQNNNNNVVESLELEQKLPNELLLNLRESLRVQTENLDSISLHQSFPQFYFPNSASETNKFDPSPVLENSFAENFNSPSYVSPATSAISHFSVSPNLATSGSQIMSDMIPAATSAANSPTVGLEFPFDQFEFDGHNFTFDNTRFFY